jgi:predicted nucleic acid-binding protein
VASIYTFSETLQVYTFVYQGGMYDLTDGFLRARVTPDVMKKPRHERFKHFLKFYPVECEAAWQTICYRVSATEEVFDQYQIKLIHPLPSPQLTNVSRQVINFASILKDFFVGLEANDAIHLSLANHLNAEAVVSLDSSMCSVDSFTIYAHS